MLRIVLAYGVAAGLIVAAPMFAMLTLAPRNDIATSPLTGYLIMMLALSLVFVGVKRYRDRVQGGVIKFMPAFFIGLAISAVAGIIYVIGWEITLAATDFAFIDGYSEAMIAAERAKAGVTPADMARVTAQMAEFRTQYANPLFRLPMTFIEIFPVGLLIALISAALLRNPRFLPARAASAFEPPRQTR